MCRVREADRASFLSKSEIPALFAGRTEEYEQSLVSQCWCPGQAWGKRYGQNPGTVIRAHYEAGQQVLEILLVGARTLRQMAPPGFR